MKTIKNQMIGVISFIAILGSFHYSQAGMLDNITNTGYAEASLYPAHNEYDPNPKVEFKDRVVARYGLEIYTEIKHKGFPIFLFAHPFLLMGDSRPQLDYNYKANPIVIQVRYGGGYRITENLDIRLTHNEWIDIGGYKGERLVWNSLSVRYKW